MNDNGNTSYQNLWDAAKAVFTGQLTTLNTYQIKQKQFKINDPKIHLGEREKEKQSKSKRRRKEIITRRAGNNKIENRQPKVGGSQKLIL